MDTEVVLREVAAAAANLIDLDERFGIGRCLCGDGYPGAYASAIGLGTTVRIFIQLRTGPASGWSRSGEVGERC